MKEFSYVKTGFKSKLYHDIELRIGVIQSMFYWLWCACFAIPVSDYHIIFLMTKIHSLFSKWVDTWVTWRHDPFHTQPAIKWHNRSLRVGPLTSHQTTNTVTCHSGGHYWNYYPGTLPCGQVTAALLKIKHQSSNELQRPDQIDGLVQGRRNSIASAPEFRLSRLTHRNDGASG